MPSEKLRGESAHTRVSRVRLPPPPPPTPMHSPPPPSITPRRSPPDLMTTVAPGDPPPSLLLGPLLGNLPPDLLQKEVLRRLGPRGLASLAGAGRVCAAAVAATALMQWARLAKSTTAPRHLGYPLPRPTAVFEGGLFTCRSWREPRGVGVGAQHWLHVESEDMCARRCGRTPGVVAVGAGAWLPVGYVDHCVRRSSPDT